MKKNISIKGLAVVAMALAVVFSPSAHAANFHSISDVVGVAQQINDVVESTRTANSNRNLTHPVEQANVPSAVQLPGVRKVTQDSVSDFVYGSKADFNVVGNLRRPEADVMTINPWSGVVCQYTIDTQADFVEFLKWYVRDGFILVMDTKKAIRGFESAARSIRSEFFSKGKNGDMLTVKRLTVEDLEEDEVTMCKGFLKGKQFIACEVHKDYQLLIQKGSAQAAAPQQIVVSDGRSKNSQMFDDINNVVSTINNVDSLWRRWTNR